MTTKVSKVTAIDLSTKRLAALRAYVKNTKTEIAIDGVSHKLPQVIAIYQGSIDSRAAVDTKQAEMKEAMATRTTAETQRRAADRALKPWVIGQFGPNSQEAIDFGFPPRKVPVRTVESKQKAVAQAQATREARGTMGKKAKLKIKGVVPSPTTTPVPPAPAPAAPAMAAAPASQAPPPTASVASPPAGGASSPVTNATTPPGAATPVTNGAASHS